MLRRLGLPRRSLLLQLNLLLLFFGGSRLSESKAFRRIALTETQTTSEGYTVNTLDNSRVGKRGTAYTVLRPSGKVMIEEQVYDAFTRGDYVERGENIEVLANEGITLKVKKISQ